MMRKIMIMSLFLLTYCCFSQEKQQDTSYVRVRADINTKRLRGRLWKKPFKNKKLILISTLTLKLQSISYIEGATLELDDYVLFVPSIGVSHSFDGVTRFQTGMEFRFRYPHTFMRISYGYSGGDHGVVGRVTYLLLPRFALGVQFKNEDYGPRMEFSFPFGKKKKDLGLYVSYLSDGFNFGVRYDFNVVEFLGLQKKK